MSLVVGTGWAQGCGCLRTPGGILGSRGDAGSLGLVVMKCHLKNPQDLALKSEGDIGGQTCG